MPELPEVETITRELKENILNKTIENIEVLNTKSFVNPDDIDINGEIETIDRIGKYIVISIKEKATIFIHLRMTGKLIMCHGEETPRYIRIVFTFTDKTTIYFQDIRKFGRIEVYPYKTQLTQIKKIGIDALDKKLHLHLFEKIITSKKQDIQSILLDQTLIAGIGNIYMQEILYDAKISPIKNANSLKTKEIEKIYKSTIKILKIACKYNGTTISDFRTIDNKTGQFQNLLKVYGKKTCSKCKQPLTKIKNKGRTTTYCQKCQK